VKRNMPCAGEYDDPRQLGKIKIEGGAPNNFLLMKNERQSAPFNSTVQKQGGAINKN